MPTKLTIKGKPVAVLEAQRRMFDSAEAVHIELEGQHAYSVMMYPALGGMSVLQKHAEEDSWQEVAIGTEMYAIAYARYLIDDAFDQPDAGPGGAFAGEGQAHTSSVSLGDGAEVAALYTGAPASDVNVWVKTEAANAGGSLAKIYGDSAVFAGMAILMVFAVGCFFFSLFLPLHHAWDLIRGKEAASV